MREPDGMLDGSQPRDGADRIHSKVFVPAAKCADSGYEDRE
jgi:hypothetical protein